MTAALFEEWNSSQVDATLEAAGPYHPRITFHIRTEGVVYRFIRDLEDRVINGNTYSRVTFMSMGSVENSEGDVADRLDVNFDGAGLKYPNHVSVVTAFSQALDKDLRGAAVQVGLVLLDKVTMQPVGLKADFVGYVDGAELDLETGAEIVLSLLSQETFYHTREPERSTDVAHGLIFPNDGIYKHVADTVRRKGESIWNGKEGSATTAQSGGGGVRNPSININSF